MDYKFDKTKPDTSGNGTNDKVDLLGALNAK